MYRKFTKRVLLGVLAFALLITTVTLMPTDAQAARKATIVASYTDASRHQLSGQEGQLQVHPVKLNAKKVVKNRKAKAKYTFYAVDKNKLTISKTGKITALNGCQDGEVVEIIVKETLNRKTRKVGTVKFTAVLPKVLQNSVAWQVGKSYSLTSEKWIADSDKDNFRTVAAYAPGKYAWCSLDAPVTEMDIQEGLRVLNGGSKKEKDYGYYAGDYFEWDSENKLLNIQNRGDVYFMFYAYNESTKQYYYVGMFEAYLIEFSN